jgi:predicted permease
MGRDLIRDLRFGARMLTRQPGFTFVAVAVLGLGIGAPTTVLTLVNRIFFQSPAEVSEPDRILRAYRSWAPGQGGGSLSNPDYVYYRENVATLSGLAAYGGGGFVGAFSTGADEPDQVRGLFVSDNYFDVLGVRPEHGRFFLAEENAAPGTRAVAVLSDGFWRRSLGADPAAVGRTVSVNGIPFTVVGVAPAAFQGVSPVERAPDAWFPIAMAGALTRAEDSAWWQRLADSRDNWLTLVGRLAPGVTFEAAEANLTALSDALTYDGRGEEEGLMVRRDYLYNPTQATTLADLSRLLLAVVALVLVIAAANVAVLLLSRATTRGREMGIRTAMGAGRGRLFRQLLAESLLLGTGGGAVGVGLAFAFSDAAATLLPFSFMGDFHPDLRVLGMAVAISVGASALVGLAPALHVARADAARTIDGARIAAGRRRTRDALVVGQVALSLVLVAGAVLFARSFQAARTQDLGFETADRLVLQVDLRAQGYTEDEGRAFLPRALERLAAVPGVERVVISRMIPFQGDWSTEVDPPPGARSNTEDGKVTIGLNTVSPGYFDVMGLDIVQGRPLGPEDTPDGVTAIVLNETLADMLFPEENAVGRTIPLPNGMTFEVVGVARDAVYYALGEGPTTQLYRALAQAYQPRVHFVLRTRGDAASLATAAQAALRELDPTLAFPWVSTLESVFEDQTARFRISAVLVGIFSALALILAATGLYGVVSFLVAQRTREIGVRMALGADRGRVAGEVVRTGLRLAALGLLIGLVGAVAARRLTASLLFGTVRAEDPLPLVAGCLILAAVAAVASLLPARRATLVDPMEAIRAD